MIARVADGLPLAATMQEDEQVRNLLQWNVTLNIERACNVSFKQSVT